MNRHVFNLALLSFLAAQTLCFGQPVIYARGIVNAASSLRAKRDKICAGLAHAGFEVFEPHGTYFVTTDIRSMGFDDGYAFCRSLPERCGVVAVPNVVFYDDKIAGLPLVRFAFCKRDEVIDEAVNRLKGLVA